MDTNPRRSLHHSLKHDKLQFHHPAQHLKDVEARAVTSTTQPGEASIWYIFTGPGAQCGHVGCIRAPGPGTVAGPAHAAAGLPVRHGLPGHTSGQEAVAAAAVPVGG